MAESPDPFARITWTDPVSGCHAYVVIDRLIGGVARGGIRMRPGCDLDEVLRLAQVMTNKYGVLNLPSGGAKGGIDFDPHDSRAGGVLRRFVGALRPIFDEWLSAGEDMGVSQHELDAAFVEAGLRTASHATLKRLADPDASGRARAAGVAVKVDGIFLPEVIGGYGVAEAAEAAGRHIGLPLAGATAVVQGFGSMGGATARYLSMKGVRIVAIADAHGIVVNRRGLDVEALLKSRNSFGEIDRSSLKAHTTTLPASDLLKVEADIFVPAAIADAITAKNCDEVGARLVIEAANIPTSIEAQSKLHERGVIVIPDFVANSAAIAWWWAILRQQIPPDASAAFAHVSKLMLTTVEQVLSIAAERGVSPHEAAVVLARQNLDRLELSGRVP